MRGHERARRPSSLLLSLGLAAALGACSKRSEPGREAVTEGAAPTPSGAEATEASAVPALAAGEPSLAKAGAPVVDLSGITTLPAVTLEGARRLASIAMLTEVLSAPRLGSTRLGALRAGAVVEADAEPAGTQGCAGGWHRIRPEGYVCVGPKATFDLEHPIARASTRRPDVSQKLPYMYGVVTRGGPVYSRIPTEDELRQHEPNLDSHLAKWRRDKESGATYGLDVWLKWASAPAPPALDALEQKVTDATIPWFLRDGAVAPNLSGLVAGPGNVKIGEASRRVGLSFVDSFLHEGRRYNVTSDLRVAPADRFRPIRGSDYHGVRIGVDVDFPFALVRRAGGRLHSISGDKLVDAGELEWRSAVALTGKQKFFGGKLHYETKDGHWVDDRHAGRIEPAKKMPAWGKKGEKWIDVNLTKQVLIAYEGEKPVYATLVSSGAAGLDDPKTTHATTRGIYRIYAKFLTTTMDSDAAGEEFELRDVPYVQYFHEGYALHGAYWHDSFGRPRSHGCLNLSPEDARRLFFWTEPQVPTGWHAAERALTGTVVFVHP